MTQGGATLLDLSYGYGAGAGQMGSGSTPGNSGQLVSVTGTVNGQNRNQTFTYDNVGRLVTATGLTSQGAWARRHDYDRYGNRTRVWDAVSGGNPLQNTMIAQANGMPTNRIASVNGTAFEYDAGGNVTREGLARAYAYDAENRLVSVSVNGVASETYGYDAANRRVKKEVGGVVTHYIWEGNQVIAEYERGGGSTQATGTRYYLQDRLSPRIITGGDGTVVGTADHLPFGEEIGVSGESEKHKFTTYERDGPLDYAVSRYYASPQGRFNQVDPLGIGAASLAEPQSLNLYTYCWNDPINFVDSDGHFPIAVAIILAGGLIGGAISAINAPEGQRLSAFGKGFVTGAVATSFGVLGAATGTVLGAAVAGTAGGFASSVAGDLYDGKPIDYGAATRGAILNGSFAGLGTFVAGTYYPIANSQFRIVYENRPFLQNLWALSRWRPISWWGSYSVRTAGQESFGVLTGSGMQQLVTNLTQSPAPVAPRSFQPAGGASIRSATLPTNIDISNLTLSGDPFYWLGMAGGLPSVDGGYGISRPMGITLFGPGGAFYFPSLHPCGLGCITVTPDRQIWEGGSLTPVGGNTRPRR